MANSLDTFLNYALQIGASDLILAEGLVPAVRIAGQVRMIPDAPKLEFGDLENFLGPLDGESGAFRGGPWENIEWRVRYSREAFGKMATLHPIGLDAPMLASLEVPDSVTSLLGACSGIVLFAGPMACGKTTTASAYVSELCTKKVLRASFLDPLPEYKMQTGQSLVKKNRAHVSLVDEIAQNVLSGTDLFWLGDLQAESCVPMLKAAESGALVVATVNAGSAKDVLTYLLSAETAENKKLAQTLLAANLKAIVTQRLILSADQTSLVSAWEVLYNDTNIAPLIHAGEYYKVPQAMRSAISEGMLPLDDSLLALVKDNRITKDAARLYAVDESHFL
ncbi:MULTISPECIES: ATPase, T2SS/T4P/T4SS family [Hallerella]|uniref:ATPase, T2SS/T4P/T4SS family n=1 Tax=Hallerella TaxID=2815788 RepID=UPI000D0D77BB|nr:MULTISPECIES: ATPase, T2SS/T4P/T4SS family [Hallerella]MCI6874320.1 Flp pilus assembly complex ATPase component TadA [Hallerella sp.]MDY5030196.1 ATPase, T2SS/T4P/T4SS family [Hallerella succinigenes]